MSTAADNYEESFEELLKESDTVLRRFRKGQKVDGTVTDITPEWVFMDCGGKSEAVLSREEFVDDTGALTISVGQPIAAYFLDFRDGELVCTTRIDGNEAGRTYLEEAWRSGIPVEGFVEKEIKGGYEVRIAGGLRAFCPHSQMCLPSENNPETVVGTKTSFRIIEYGEKGRNILLSSRVIREEEREQEQRELRQRLSEGMKLRGRVAAVREFGAFVDIGGLQGMVPVSEIAWGRVASVDAVLAVGQEVDVVITRIDRERDRIGLSIRQTIPDPWEGAEKRYPAGSRHSGTVVRLAPFGAFVSLEDGVDGLLHVSKLGSGKKISHPREVLAEGAVIEVEVEGVDTEKKRISLVPAAYADMQSEAASDDYQSYAAGKDASMGTLGDLLKGKIGQTKRR